MKRTESWSVEHPKIRPPASVGYNRSPLRPTLPCRAQEKEEEEEEEEELLEEVSAEFAPCHAMHLHVTALLRIVMACERLRPKPSTSIITHRVCAPSFCLRLRAPSFRSASIMVDHPWMRAAQTTCT